MAADPGARPNGSTEAPFPPAAVGWYSTVLLALLYWLSLLDRSIISLLVDPIRSDLGISDVQFGLLHGMAFAVTFSLFGLAAGTLADRLSRRWIIFASVSIWSLATAACGLARSFGQLWLARVGVGAGEAGLNPCATSMITDLFPKRRLTLALAVYSMGASVGSGCALIFGGMLIDAVAATDSVVLPGVGPVKPWQAVFLIIGVPGVFASLLSFTMPEPARRGVRQDVRSLSVWRSLFSGYPELLRFIRSRPRFFFHHYAGFGLGTLGFVGGQAWYPAHMSREFGWSSGEIGLGLGVALVSGGLLGKLLCGTCVDALFGRGFRDAQFRWYGGCLLAAVPVGVIAMTSASPWVFLGGLALFMVLLSPMNALFVSSLNLVTPNELRGAGVAFYSATIGLLALSIGPVAVAALSDHVYGGGAIGLGTATLIGITCPLGALVLLSGLGTARQAVAAAERWNA